MTTTNPSQPTVSYAVIKLGIDAHAKYYWVSRQVDGATPQPVQKMTYDKLMLFVVKQQRLTDKVVTCYEAGAFGFHLYPLSACSMATFGRAEIITGVALRTSTLGTGTVIL